MDEYMDNELELSPCQQLDVMGMQPHSREYLEYEVNATRSVRKLQQISSIQVDYQDGIQYSRRP